jgi:two-component system response regulator (stage 0 sporulation protein A)
MGKLLIADCSEDYRTALAAALSSQYHVLTCRTGTEALAILYQERPDIVVLDLMLPELDGLTLLERACQDGLHPMVLAVTPLLSPYVFSCAQRLGIEYLVRKPCDIDAIVSRIKDLSQPLTDPISHVDPIHYISEVLLSLHFSTKHNGFSYLREAILLMAKDPAQSVTKVLYPAIAHTFSCQKENVERSIRTAIETAWLHRDDGIWRQYFPPGANGEIPRPTNADFVARLAEYIRYH